MLIKTIQIKARTTRKMERAISFLDLRSRKGKNIFKAISSKKAVERFMTAP